MDARWTYTRVRGIVPTIRAALRAGTHGTGQELGACEYWPDSNKSQEDADRICAGIEADARAAGYTILPEEAE